MDKNLAAAQVIASARRSLTRLPLLDPALAPENLSGGYQIQDSLHGILTSDLGPIVGYKIGCTSAVMQKYLAISHPCSGGLYAHRVYESGVTLSASDFVRIGVECEIAVRLARDLISTDVPFTGATVGKAVAEYFPAIEIVDDRYVKWETLGAPTLIADDFFSSGIVLGKPKARSDVPDLLSVHGRALINGIEGGRGTGADLLGHPHNALAWLANHLAQQGKGLKAGQIVMTGSLVQTIWVNAGDVIDMDYGTFGSVRLALS